MQQISLFWWYGNDMFLTNISYYNDLVNNPSSTDYITINVRFVSQYRLFWKCDTDTAVKVFRRDTMQDMVSRLNLDQNKQTKLGWNNFDRSLNMEEYGQYGRLNFF